MLRRYCVNWLLSGTTKAIRAMSTKIYNGVKFKSNNLPEIIHELYSIKEQAVKNSNLYQIEHPDRVVHTLLKNGFVDDIEDFFNEELLDSKKCLYTRLLVGWKTSKVDSVLLYEVQHFTRVCHLRVNELDALLCLLDEGTTSIFVGDDVVKESFGITYKFPSFHGIDGFYNRLGEEVITGLACFLVIFADVTLKAVFAFAATTTKFSAICCDLCIGKTKDVIPC